jgi:hypothetical protein
VPAAAQPWSGCCGRRSLTPRSQASAARRRSASSPSSGLARQPHDQLAHLSGDRRPAGPTVRIGPPASNKLAMPAHQRFRPYQESVPARPRQHPAHRRKQQPIV